MQLLSNQFVRICVDDRFPRVLWYEHAKSGCRVGGEPQAIAPRVYVFRAKDLATITSDDDCVNVEYALSVTGDTATYHATVTADGKPAAGFDVTVALDGADAKIVFGNVTEHKGYSLLSFRLGRVVAASSRDEDARLVTCGWQGRLLDPHKCAPGITDFSWHGSVARHCGAAYRDGFMVTFDMLGLEDLFVQEVRQHTRIAEPETVASLGGELMHRQRPVESSKGDLKHFPPPEKNPPRADRLKVPILCAPSKEIRLHFITPRGKAKLDWTHAARYFQSTLPADWRCEKRYDGALSYKIHVLTNAGPQNTFEQVLECIKRLWNLTDGMRQMCYMVGMGGPGTPGTFKITPEVGNVARLRKCLADAKKYNAVLSMHDIPTQVNVADPSFNPAWIARDSYGRMWDAGVWDDMQFVEVSTPRFLKELLKVPARLVREFGVHTTYHCDTFGGFPYHYDANPNKPCNAAEINEANFAFIRELRKHDIDLTAESLSHFYVPWIGHVWALFNYGTIWQGEERIPFANFIYHGATSYNGGHGNIPLSYFSDKPGATIKDTILGILVQGGGAGLEFGSTDRSPADLADLLYLAQPPYAMLRNRKWIGYSRNGNVIRVDYAAQSPASKGEASFIEIDTAANKYRVEVDGALVARDFTTVFASPRKGAVLAYSMTDQDLDWPAPKSWKNGPVKAVVLTDTGPGVALPACVEKGRLRLRLRAHQPVRLEK